MLITHGYHASVNVTAPVQARHLEKTAAPRLAEIDQRIEMLLSAHRSAMSEDELRLRGQRAQIVQQKVDQSAAPGM